MADMAVRADGAAAAEGVKVRAAVVGHSGAPRAGVP